EPRDRDIAGGKDIYGHRSGTISAAAAAKRLEREKKGTEAQRQPPKLIIRNLPWSIKEPEQLALLFRSYGKVKHALLPRKKANMQAGFGFVVIRGWKNVENALAGEESIVVDGRTPAEDGAVAIEVG